MSANSFFITLHVSLILLACLFCNRCIGDTQYVGEQPYDLNVLQQIGCAKTRRLLTLKSRQDFLSVPTQASDFEEKEEDTHTANRPLPTRLAFSPDNLPSCRVDRPDLYTARQCSALDCFCVNVTTGQFFPGTRTSVADLDDCSTALLKIQLVVYQNEPVSYDTQPYTKTDKWADTPTSSYWEPRIVRVLQELCHASTGYQRVAAINRLSFNEAHNRSLVGDSSRMITFEILLLSTGHGQNLANLEELIKHRLDEAYLAGVGPLEPNASYIQLIKERMEDPEPELQVNQKVKLISREETGAEESNIFRSQTDATHQLDPPQQDYPGSNRKRPISVRQTAHDLAVQNSWRHREILNQPGVIAGIVGSTIAALLLLILLILFCIYRLRKKDEGSYSLEEPKKSPATSNSYMHPSCREFYA